MYEKVIENIELIAQNKCLKNLPKDMISEIKFSRKNLFQYFVSIMSAVILSYVLTYKGDTVELMSYAVDVINGVALAFLAIIFGTYAIFQALMTDSVIWVLLKSDNNLLNISNRSFLHLILLYLVNIMANIILLILLNAIPKEYCFFDSLVVCNIVAFVLELIYFAYSFLIFYEMKNFTVNLYQMFNVYNIYRAIDLLEKSNEDDNDKNI